MSELPQKASFTIREAVSYLGVSRRTIYRWIEAGELLTIGIPYHLRIVGDSLQRKMCQLCQPTDRNWNTERR